MRPILTSGGSRLEVNALFIQPTKWCALSCKGCYVKAHTKMHHQMKAELISTLLTEMADGQRCFANQITVSIDELPQRADEKSAHQRLFMEKVWLATIGVAQRFKQVTQTEIHITANSLRSLDAYYGAHIHPTHVMNLDMVSLSSITDEDLERIEGLTKRTKINYNHMLPHDLTSRTLHKYLEQIVRIGDVVDSIYLVIFKRPLGEKMGHRGFQAAKARMRSDITVVNTLRKYLPKRIFAKINVDGCLQDSANFARTGFGCSSNVSRFQVWPDGTVSGCPYARSGVGKIALGFADILDNIRTAKEHYDFREKCYLPKVYHSLPQRSEDKGTKVGGG